MIIDCSMNRCIVIGVDIDELHWVLMVADSCKTIIYIRFYVRNIHG